MGFPFFGQSGYCGGPIRLGGKSITIPVRYPVNLQYVAQQVIGYLISMVVIQARHASLFGYVTDSNKAYTIRICQGPGNVLVETGIADWIQDLMPIAMGRGDSHFSVTKSCAASCCPYSALEG